MEELKSSVTYCGWGSTVPDAFPRSEILDVDDIREGAADGWAFEYVTLNAAQRVYQTQRNKRGEYCVCFLLSCGWLLFLGDAYNTVDGDIYCFVAPNRIDGDFAHELYERSLCQDPEIISQWAMNALIETLSGRGHN